MKDLKIRLTHEAAEILSKVHPENKKLIKSAIHEIQKNPLSGHDLQEELSGFKSHKMKRYRILYKFNEEDGFIEIYHIGHRRDIYEQFRDFLNQMKQIS